MPKTVYTATAELCPDTGLYIGSIVGLQGAHSQGATLEELRNNLKEAIELVMGEDWDVEVRISESGQNPVLTMLDWMIQAGAPVEDIDFDAVRAMADCCEEVATNENT